MDGNALGDTVETAITPFGVKKFKLSEYKEESDEDIRFIYKAYALNLVSFCDVKYPRI